MRAKMVVESILNKERYLSHEYFAQGATELCKNVTFPEVYVMFSGQNAAGVSENIMEKVFLNIKSWASLEMEVTWGFGNCLQQQIF